MVACRGVGEGELGIILSLPFWMISQFILLFHPTAVYPSLESDDDDPALKSRPKKKKNSDDAPWSPKGCPVFFPKLCGSDEVEKQTGGAWDI